MDEDDRQGNGYFKDSVLPLYAELLCNIRKLNIHVHVTASDGGDDDEGKKLALDLTPCNDDGCILKFSIKSAGKIKTASLRLPFKPNSSDAIRFQIQRGQVFFQVDWNAFNLTKSDFFWGKSSLVVGNDTTGSNSIQKLYCRFCSTPVLERPVVICDLPGEYWYELKENWVCACTLDLLCNSKKISKGHCPRPDPRNGYSGSYYLLLNGCDCDLNSFYWSFEESPIFHEQMRSWRRLYCFVCRSLLGSFELVQDCKIHLHNQMPVSNIYNYLAEGTITSECNFDHNEHDFNQVDSNNNVNVQNLNQVDSNNNEHDFNQIHSNTNNNECNFNQMDSNVNECNLDQIHSNNNFNVQNLNQMDSNTNECNLNQIHSNTNTNVQNLNQIHSNTNNHVFSIIKLNKDSITDDLDPTRNSFKRHRIETRIAAIMLEFIRVSSVFNFCIRNEDTLEIQLLLNVTNCNSMVLSNDHESDDDSISPSSFIPVIKLKYEKINAKDDRSVNSKVDNKPLHYISITSYDCWHLTAILQRRSKKFFDGQNLSFIYHCIDEGDGW